jgi:hypothetical protein
MLAAALEFLARYHFVEIVVRSEGCLTTKHLYNSFDTGRKQANKDINSRVLLRVFFGMLHVYILFLGW